MAAVNMPMQATMLSSIGYGGLTADPATESLAGNVSFHPHT